MNSRLRHLYLIVLTGSLTVTAASGAPKAKANPTNAMPRSVFVMPSNPTQGRDPFFPTSMRPYARAAAVHRKVSDFSALKLRGFSGDLPHRYVIINNHTFGAGDEGDVMTSAGRIHVRCIEVKTNSVVIEVGGQRRELFYSDNL